MTCLYIHIYTYIHKEYCLIPKGFCLNNPVQYFELSTTQHKTFKICIKASELLRNETLQLRYDHQRYLIKEIKERKQFLSQRLPHSFDELNQCLTTFPKHKELFLQNKTQQAQPFVVLTSIFSYFCNKNT